MAKGRRLQGDINLEQYNDNICGGKDSSQSTEGCQHCPGDTRGGMRRT